MSGIWGEQVKRREGRMVWATREIWLWKEKVGQQSRPRLQNPTWSSQELSDLQQSSIQSRGNKAECPQRKFGEGSWT